MTSSFCGGRGVRRLVVACGLAFLLASQMATGVPLGQETRAAPIDQGEVLSEYLSILVQQHAHKQNRASGYEGVHPLNRRGWGGASAESTQRGPHRRQATATVLPNVLPAVDEENPSTSAASASTAPSTATAASATSAAPSVTQAAASSSAASQSLPDVTPVPSASESSSSSSTSSSSRAKPSSTSSDKPTPSPSSGIGSFFSPHNKLFPLAVTVCVAVGIGVLLIVISLGKLISHARMTPEEKAGAYGDYSAKGAGAGGAAARGARSLKRALTSKKLGSFARRNHEGSVLIDVGDEVYAVTPEVAREYERERVNMGGSNGSGSSRLTTGSNSSSPLRQALKNAEMIVAANNASNVVESRPVPKGFDIHSWRASSALPGIHGKDADDEDDGLERSISQRLTDGLRALRGRGNGDTGARREGAFSFDSEKQDMGGMRQAEVPPSAYLPVITRGAKEWDISPRRESKQDSAPLQSRRADPGSLDAGLSHPRHTLMDAAVPSRSKTIKADAIPGAFPAQRPKSILIKRDDQQSGAYRHRMAADQGRTRDLQRNKTVGKSALHQSKHRSSSSTSFASPRMLGQRASPRMGAAAIFMKPSDPHADHAAVKATETHAPHTRELFRPLPMPPAFSPLTGHH